MSDDLRKKDMEQYVRAIYGGSISDFIGEIYFLSDGIAKVRGFSAGGAGNLVLICDKQMTRHSYGLTFNLNKKSAEILILSHEGKVCAGDIVLDLRENLWIDPLRVKLPSIIDPLGNKIFE